MDFENLKKKLEGCYVTVPTPFKDIKNLPLNFNTCNLIISFKSYIRVCQFIMHWLLVHIASAIISHVLDAR